MSRFVLAKVFPIFLLEIQYWLLKLLFKKGDDIIKEGLIQRFEYTHKLAWNVMKDFLKEKGYPEIFGSKDATREAFSTGLLSGGKIWMGMINSRNQTFHAYNEKVANDIFLKILEDYHPAFIRFQQRMDGQKGNSQANISD